VALKLSTVQDFISYNDALKHTVLVVEDDPSIVKIMDDILEFNNYNRMFAFTAEEGLEIIKENSIDMIITDTNLPNMSGEKFIAKLSSLNLRPPIIVITDENIDNFLKLALKYGLGNILQKPLKKDELLSLIHKLITGQGFFGLENYLYFGLKEIKTLKLKSNKEITEAIKKILDDASLCGLSEEALSFFKLLLIELISNAIYHSHGRTDLKMKRSDFTIPGDKYVEVKYASDGHKFGVSITDFMGTLSKSKFLEALIDLREKDKKLKEAIQKGEDITPFLKDSGRGLHITREISSEYYFNIRKNIKTEVVILTPIKPSANEISHQIKINEVQ
jgi:DNA-binding response OmpR family regulator